MEREQESLELRGVVVEVQNVDLAFKQVPLRALGGKIFGERSKQSLPS